MAIRMVLFDQDGTLLPMDMEAFTAGYFKLLAKKAAPHGYEPQTLVNAVWHGTAAMVKNDGSCLNEEAFWRDFAATCGEQALRDKPLFDDFYANEFRQARQLCGFNPKAAETVLFLRSAGYRAALATNPLFPSVATETRIGWAGLNPQDFEFYTSYENIGFCKPNLDYYREVLRRAGLKAEECLMVGNDVSEDMVAAQLGMQVFLLTDCLINKTGEDISRYPHGGFDALKAYVANLNTETEGGFPMIYDYTVPTGKGETLHLADYKGKVILVVNTATGCGFTPQYEPIEKMYRDYHEQGLEILDIPCNQFGGQAPGTDEEIHAFCTMHFNTTFPQMKKADVNGENELPLYTWLKSQKGFAGFDAHPYKELLEKMFAQADPDWDRKPDIKWNFTKFVIDREGNVVARFEPTADIADVEACVKALL